MTIKTSFRSFTAATFALEQVIKPATEARVENYDSKFINPDINIDYAILAIPAQAAFQAFSIELGLKMLLQKNEVELNPRGHELEKLYQKLPAKIQDNLKNKVISSMDSLTEDDFQSLLKTNSENFTKWRYFHESASLSCDKEFLGHLLVAIHNYTVDQKY